MRVVPPSIAPPADLPLAIIGARGRRYTAGCESFRLAGELASLHLKPEWQAWDPRKAERHGLTCIASLGVEGGDWRSPALVQDISVTGIALEVWSAPPSRQLWVEIPSPETLVASLQVVRVAEMPNGHSPVSARFHSLTEHARSCIARLVFDTPLVDDRRAA